MAHAESPSFMQDRLAKMDERLEKAERDLLEGREELGRQSLEAAVRISGLSNDLAAAVAAPHPRLRWRGICLCAAAAAAFFLPRAVRPVPTFTTEAGKPTQVVWPAAAKPQRNPAASQSILLSPGALSTGGTSVEEQALDRLNLALSRVPAPAVDTVLSLANSVLRADGNPVCTVRFPTGERSLLVVVKRQGDGRPLADALLRCADAVERVIY
jgi:hypothetical protein